MLNAPLHERITGATTTPAFVPTKIIGTPAGKLTHAEGGLNPPEADCVVTPDVMRHGRPLVERG